MVGRVVSSLNLFAASPHRLSLRTLHTPAKVPATSGTPETVARAFEFRLPDRRHSQCRLERDKVLLGWILSQSGEPDGPAGGIVVFRFKSSGASVLQNFNHCKTLLTHVAVLKPSQGVAVCLIKFGELPLVWRKVWSAKVRVASRITNSVEGRNTGGCQRLPARNNRLSAEGNGRMGGCPSGNDYHDRSNCK